MITNDQKYIKLLNDIKKDGRLFTINNTINTAFTRRDYFLNSALYKSIVDATSFLNGDTSLSERMFCILNK